MADGRRRRVLLGLLAVVLVGAGLALIWSSTRAPEPLAPVAPSTTYAVRSPRPEPARRVVVPPIPDDPRPSGPARALRPEDMAPNRLNVPALGVYASLEPVAFGSGRLTVPDEPWRVGIDDGSAPLRSAVGTTLLAGHVDLSGTAGALVGLSRTPIGARIYVTDTRGGVHEFVAASLQQYSKAGLPRSIFAVDGPRQLALVTCGGPVISDGATRHYRDNVVVTAVPRR